MTLKNQNRIALFVFLLLTVFCTCWHFIRKSDLNNNGIVLTGKVVKDVFATKSSVMQFEYEFVYNGKAYVNSSPSGVTNSSAFIGKTFPVRFAPESSRSEILVTPRHFERYGLVYPDSLDWVIKYVIKDF